MIVAEKIRAAEPQIRQMLEDGRSIKYISKKLEVTQSYLTQFLKEWGIKTDTNSTRRSDPLKNHAEEIISLYKSGVSTYKLEKIFDCGSSSLSRLLRQHGVVTRYHYTVNENFLDVVDSQEKAYYLGYFTADGCNNDNHQVAITSIDLEILEKLRDLVEFTGPIIKYNKKPSCIYSLRFSSKHFSDNLTRLGCPPRKTFTTYLPPEDLLPRVFLKDYIRGLLDGDGCIVPRKPPRRSLIVNILGTKPLLSSIKSFLHTELNLGGSILTKSKISSLTYEGINQPLTLLDYLYNDSAIHLDRKYQRYIAFKNTVSEANLDKVSNRRTKSLV